MREREGGVRERGRSEREREREGGVRERGRYRENLGVARWWKLIMHRSNKKSKNNSSNSTSLAFGRRQ